MSEKYKNLDLSALQAFEETEKLSPGFVKSLLEMFKDTSRENIEGMSEGFACSDCEKIWKAAHSLKSSSAVLGASELSKLAAEIEVLGMEKKLEDIGPLLEESSKFREKSLSELEEYITDLNPEQ